MGEGRGDLRLARNVGLRGDLSLSRAAPGRVIDTARPGHTVAKRLGYAPGSMLSLISEHVDQWT